MIANRKTILARALLCAPMLVASQVRAAGPDDAGSVARPLQMAQAQLTEEQKKKLEQQRQQHQERRDVPHKGPTSGAQQQNVPHKDAAPVERRAIPRGVTQPKDQPHVQPKELPRVQQRNTNPPDLPKATVPITPKVVSPNTLPPQKTIVLPQKTVTPPPSIEKSGTQFKTMPPPVAKTITEQPKFDQLQKSRTQTVEDGGRRTVVKEGGNRFIIKQDNRVIVRHNEAERFERLKGAQTLRRPNGVVETFYVRPDGFRIITESDANGRLLRRYRRGPDGREYVIFDNRKFWRNAGVAAGIAGLATIIALNLPPPRVTIPRDRYIVDYERASDDDLYEALSAPPVDELDRAYSLEEIRYNLELRERMRRIDLDTITFDFGAYEVDREQYPRLERLARSMNRLISRNPDEVFLIEGHTDAVGSDIDNASLSDRRASSVAQVLTEVFGIPPENLITQGYGEQYLKVPTQGPERLNRRVAVRRITPLMTQR